METLGLKAQTLALGEKAEGRVKPCFEKIEQTALINSAKVLRAFQNHRVSDGYFAGTTGYGYDDRGRDELEAIYAEVFDAEDALVRLNFVNGTHAIATALYGVLKPGDTLLCATGLPYDTLIGAIGIYDKAPNSLAEYGVTTKVVAMQNGRPDLPAIVAACEAEKPAAVFVQRSKGYADRITLSCDMIGEIVTAVKAVDPNIRVVVDNCYGEFCETKEPTSVGADLIAGSLIKNPGGGLAPTGGYIAGKKECVERASYRMTVPGIGRECGSTMGMNRSLYQGFFLAPHVTAQALKTAVFCSALMQELGYTVNPLPEEARYDIIQTICFGKPEPILKFCRGIQAGAPVDSYVTPEPWDMPGYDCQVIMAAGAFIQGASIELSADAPMREPYIVYMQGGLTYESGKLGILLAADQLI